MNFLFKARQRTPHELARSMREAIARLGVVQLSNGTLHLSETVGAETRRKVGEELYQSIQQAKHILYGEAGNEPVPELVAQFAQETYQDRLMQYLLVILPRLEFEVRRASYPGTQGRRADLYRAAAAEHWDTASDGRVHLF